MTFQILNLQDCPQRLDEVLKVWRRSSGTVGYMPLGGFEQHRDAGWILVCVSEDTCVGYAMFRKGGDVATLVHLCVVPVSRGKGVARLLMDAVKTHTSNRYELRLRCRRDFAANRLWPRLGFELVGEVAGNGVARKPLNVWRFVHMELPLFAFLAKSVPRERKLVAVDANVFFDFSRDTRSAVESRALLADWLSEHISLGVTSELNTEIDRNDAAREREQQRALASRYETLSGTAEAFARAVNAVTDVVGPPRTERDASDIRQVARAEAGGADYFVTRDCKLLEAQELLGNEISVTILRPAELITSIESVVQKAEYQPARFEGSRLLIASPEATADDGLRLAYLASARGEHKHEFFEVVRSAHVQTNAVLRQILAPGDVSVVLVAIHDLNSRHCELTLLRSGEHRLAPTALRRFLISLVATRSGGSISVTDAYLSPLEERALQDCEFVKTQAGWVRFIVHGVSTARSLTQGLQHVGGLPSHCKLADDLRELAALPQERAQLERHLWPAKFTDVELPSFVVPIRPGWASQLFDSGLAGSQLFGLPPELGFSLENAYYRSARPGVLRAPGRILWYVSKNDRYPQSGAIRACSYLDEVAIGKPKDLFRRFRRLGIYRWKNVLEAAKGDTQHPVMALRFSGTELLREPLVFSEVQRVLRSHQRARNSFVSPVEVSHDVFLDIYCEGQRLARS